jgi:hypothetical protein
VAESAVAAWGLPQLADLSPDNPAHRGHHQLSDSLAPPDRKGSLTQIHQNYLDHASVIGIDGPRRVGERDSVA